MFGELAQLAFGNLLRARARLIMTAGGVLVGTTAVILLVDRCRGRHWQRCLAHRDVRFPKLWARTDN